MRWASTPTGLYKYPLPTSEKTMTEQTDVRVFMESCGQVVNTTPIDLEDCSDTELAQAELYLNLIDEEFGELADACADLDMVEIADACGDLIWVILGLCNTLGIPMARVWHEIRDSNMSKVVDGKVIRREDGKILKPDTFFPPNIERALGR
jgi:NTP pyrophosphatase (non-canonical NTP hydrolase)